MIPNHRRPTHPGEILLEEFLNPLGITQVAFAKHIRVPNQLINEIVRGKRGITARSAWLFSQAFGTTPEFWAKLQMLYDLAKERPRKAVKLLPGVTAPEDIEEELAEELRSVSAASR